MKLEQSQNKFTFFLFFACFWAACSGQKDTNQDISPRKQLFGRIDKNPNPSFTVDRLQSKCQIKGQKDLTGLYGACVWEDSDVSVYHIWQQPAARGFSSKHYQKFPLHQCDTIDPGERRATLCVGGRRLITAQGLCFHMLARATAWCLFKVQHLNLPAHLRQYRYDYSGFNLWSQKDQSFSDGFKPVAPDMLYTLRELYLEMNNGWFRGVLSKPHFQRAAPLTIVSETKHRILYMHLKSGLWMKQKQLGLSEKKLLKRASQRFFNSINSVLKHMDCDVVILPLETVLQHSGDSKVWREKTKMKALSLNCE